MAAPMTAQAIVRTQTTEERDYERWLRRIASRKRRLTELQAEIAALKVALARFEAVCQARVGDLLADLRRVSLALGDYERRLSRLLTASTLDPSAPFLDDEPSLFPPDNETIGTGAQRDTWQPIDPPAPHGLDKRDEAEVKRLYLDLAKRCHPDYAQTDAERLRREQLMQRVNEAFRDRDLSALQELQQTTEADDPAFAARSPRERIAWATAEVVRLDTLLAALKTELAVLHGFEMYRLWQRHEAGKPVLALLEDDLEARLSAETRRLDRLIAAYRSTLDERERLAAG